jgi:hypothetical protein
MRLLVGAQGGAKFLKAMLTGDIAPDEAIEERGAKCRQCPTRVRASVSVEPPSDWCGQPLLVVPGVSCGCLLVGKTAVASESCPQEKWSATDRRSV